MDTKRFRLKTLFLALCLTTSAMPLGVAAADGDTLLISEQPQVGLSNFTKVNAYEEGVFTDIGNTWYTDNVKSVYELGLMIGSGNAFTPMGNISLAEALTLACRLYNTYYGIEHTYSGEGAWYQPYVDYAVSVGIIKEGQYSDYTALANRADIAVILANAVPAEALAAINDIKDGAIPDVAAGAAYEESVYRLYNAGILAGGDVTGTFSPGRTITRAEVAAMVTRIADVSLRLQNYTINANLIVNGDLKDYVIVVPADATEAETTAAQALQEKLAALRGVTVQIVDDTTAETDKEIVVGATNRETESEFDRTELGLNGYTFKVRGDKLFLVGGEQYGTLYGVSAFTEQFLGSAVFDADVKSVITSIDGIGQATLAAEDAIDAAYYAYTHLDADEQKYVINSDTLDTLRADLARLYVTKDYGDIRFDRSKLLLGTYGFGSYVWDDEHVKQLADAGIDMVVGASYNTTLLDLLEKYDVGAFISGAVPGWWGDYGQNGGKMESFNPLSSYEASAAGYVDHPAVWAIDVGDEPSALDFPYYGKVIDYVKNNFPTNFAFLNLYPNYASEQQMGTSTYAEHIAEYVKYVNTDYISYDHYMYRDGDDHDADTKDAVENLSIVANACRETGKDLWYVMQVNSNAPALYLSEERIKLQAYSAMVYGAKCINYACWTAGWWYNFVVDSEGNLTEQYEKVKNLNEDLNALSPVYMRYTNKAEYFIGGFVRKYVRNSYLKTLDPTMGQDIICDLQIGDGDLTKVVAIGYFEKNVGDGCAMMLTNFSDPNFKKENIDTSVSFTVSKKNAVVTAYVKGVPTILTAKNGVYCVELNAADGVFVTIDY